MRWFRRRSSATALEQHTAELVLASRTERALVALAVHAQQLDGRLERLERRLDEATEANDALKAGDLARYQQKIREAEDLVRQAGAASAPPPTTTTTTPTA